MIHAAPEARYDPGIEATDPVMIVHEQMAYWRRRRFTYAMMCSAVTGWNVHYASPEAAFDVLLMAWEGLTPRASLVL